MSNFKKLCSGYGAYIHLWFLFYKTRRWLRKDLTPLKRMVIELQYQMVVTTFLAIKGKRKWIPIPSECNAIKPDITETYEKINKRQLAVEAIRERQTIQQQQKDL